MTKTIHKFTFFGIVNLIISSTAYAECRRSYVCDDYGNNCQYMDICDESLDLPSVDIDPLPSLPTTDL